MKVIEPGHRYMLDSYDPSGSGPGKFVLRERIDFFKKVGPGFPGNEGEPHWGTNCQEVLRAEIDRVKYLRWQAVELGDLESVADDDRILTHFRGSIRIFEVRAARRKGIAFDPVLDQIEDIPPCPRCGHIFPHAHEESDARP